MNNAATNQASNEESTMSILNYGAKAKEIKKLGFYRAYSSDGLSGRGMYWYAPVHRDGRNTHMRIGEQGGGAADAYRLAVQYGLVIHAVVVK